MRSVLKGCFGSSIQGIVGVGHDLTLPIRDGRQIAIVVVRIVLGLEQRVLPRARAIHIGIRIDRLLALGIGDGQQIAVGIIAKLRDAVDRVGELRNPIQGIGRIDGLLAQRIR